MCKRQSADTNVLIGRYRLSTERPILIIGARLVMIIFSLDIQITVTAQMLHTA